MLQTYIFLFISLLQYSQTASPYGIDNAHYYPSGQQTNNYPSGYSSPIPPSPVLSTPDIIG
jgi:hypothetical protein